MIINITKQEFIKLCEDRNYDIIDVMPCVIAQNGDVWTIDKSSPYFPRMRPIVILAGAST